MIFLEHSPSLRPRFLDRTLPTLESAAVLSHMEQHTPQLVPVDAEIDRVSIKLDSDALLKRLTELSVRHEQLGLLNAQQTAQRGFVYLNSLDCALVQIEIERETIGAVQAAADPALTELHRKWLSLHEKREETMIRGVEAYARDFPFLKAVLLRGAAHSPSLYSRVRSRAAGNSSPVRWEFDWPFSEELLG